MFSYTLDFDLDDPLAGILSDEESTSVKRKAPVADEKKKPTTGMLSLDRSFIRSLHKLLALNCYTVLIFSNKMCADIVFDDDDDGPLGSMLIDDDSNTKISHLGQL